MSSPKYRAGNTKRMKMAWTQGRASLSSRGQEAKVTFKENIVTWKNSSARRICIVSGGRPLVWEMKQGELQAVMANVALVTPAVTSQVAQFSAFDVSHYMPHGDPGDPSKDNPFRTAVPFLGQCTQTSSSLSPKRD